MREVTVMRGTGRPVRDLHIMVSFKQSRSAVCICNYFKNAVSFEKLYGKQYEKKIWSHSFLPSVYVNDKLLKYL